MSFLFKIFYKLYRLAAWGWQWGNRHLTRAGLAALGGAMVSGFMGVDTENSVGYQMFALLAGLLAGGLLFCFRFRGKFSVSRRLPRFATVGQPMGYSVAVRNLTGKSQIGLNLLENLTDTRPSLEEWRAYQAAEQKQARSFQVVFRPIRNPFKRVSIREAALGPVPPNAELSVSMELTPLRRGVLRFDGVVLARPDPMGLCRSIKKISCPQSVLVLPRRYPLPPVAMPGTMKYQDNGVALASNVGQSDEFVALRDYRQGDPLRHIHWRSWARTGKPVVKEFEDEFFVRHALVLDTFTDHPYSELLDEAVSVAASFACTLQTQESLLDLLFVGPDSYCFTIGRGLAHADQMLEILASVKHCPHRPFDDLAHLVMNHIKAVSGSICIFLAWDAPRQEFVKKLRALGVPVRVLVLAAAGQARKLEPGVMSDEPENLYALELGKVQEGLAKLA
jgi:uncharacterized protein (DUF58 family)